jgi:hypothetical protein
MEFVGWNIRGTNTPVAALTEFDEDTALTARFENVVVFHTVTWYDRFGAPIRVDSIEHGRAAVPPTVANIPGAVRSIWTPANFTITAPTRFDHSFEMNQYTVNFRLLTDSGFVSLITPTPTARHGEAVHPNTVQAARDAVGNSGYDFIGWDSTAFNNVTTNLTITAIATIKTYTVRFLAQGIVVWESDIVPHGSDIVAPDPPSIQGKQFVNWATGVTAGTVVSNITGNRTFNAAYTDNLYTITFRDTAGVSLGTQTGIKHGDELNEHGSAATGPTMVVPQVPSGEYPHVYYDADFLLPVHFPLAVFGNMTLHVKFEGTAATYSAYRYRPFGGGVEIYGYTGNSRTLNIPAKLGGQNVVKIADNAFQGNRGIETVVIPEHVVAIGHNAFMNCSMLSSVTLGAALAEIGNNAFRGTALTSINLPQTLATIGTAAFADNGKLTAINAHASNPSFATISDVLFNKAATLLIAYPAGRAGTDYELPLTVEDISPCAFIGANLTSLIFRGVWATEDRDWGIDYFFAVLGDNAVLIGVCEDLTLADIPSTVNGGTARTVRSIAEGALADTARLEEIRIPATVQTIGAGAFAGTGAYRITFAANSAVQAFPAEMVRGALRLTEIIVPILVTNIGEAAFAFCPDLVAVQFPHINPAVLTIHSDAFAGHAGALKLYVPSSFDDAILLAYKDRFDGTGGRPDLAALFAVTGTAPRITFNSAGGSTVTQFGGTLLMAPPLPTRAGHTFIRWEEDELSVEYPYLVQANVTFVAIWTNNTAGTEGLAFSYDAANDNYTLTGYNVPTGTEPHLIIVIPALYNGKPVVAVGTGTPVFGGAVTQIIFAAGSQVRTIGADAFNGLTSLAQINLPLGLTSIGAGAFGGNTALGSIAIPETVTSIGAGAFTGATSLANVTFTGKSMLTVLGAGAFTGTPWLADQELRGDFFIVGRLLAGAFRDVREVRIMDAEIYAIAAFAFKDSHDIISAIIPSTVEFIGEGAFYNCSGLISVFFGQAKIAFMGANAFAKTPFFDEPPSEPPFVMAGNVLVRYFGNEDTLDLAKYEKDFNLNITAIAEAAFMGRHFSRITLPAGLEFIGAMAFWGCNNLYEITIPASVRHIGADAFRHSGLSRVTFAAGSVPLTIGAGAFAECVKLGEDAPLTLPARLVELGAQAFLGNEALTTVIMTEGSTLRLGAAAFRGCKELVSITISSSVQYLGADLFRGCGKLEHINFGGSGSAVNFVGSGKVYSDTKWYENKIGFGGLIIFGKVLAEYVAPNGADHHVNIPEGIERIRAGAFVGQAKVIGISFPSTLRYIEDNVFAATGITDIIIPEGVVSIGAQAFAGNPFLETVSIASSVLSVDNRAFADNPALYKVYLRRDAGDAGAFTGTVIGNDAFARSPSPHQNLRVYCNNDTSRDAYRTFGTSWGLTSGREHFFRIGDFPSVVFRHNGGSPVDTIAAETVWTSPETRRLNYTFVGWFTLEGLGPEAPFPLTVRSDMILRAEWVPNNALPAADEDRGGGMGFISSGVGNNDILDSYALNRTESKLVLPVGANRPLVGDRNPVVGIRGTGIGDGSGIDPVFRAAHTNIREIIFASGNRIAGLTLNVFYLLPNLQAFTVFAGDTTSNYVTVGGVLFTRDMRTLVAFPSGLDVSEYTVPDLVEHILPFAFAGNGYLTKINFPAGLKTIGAQAFNHALRFIDFGGATLEDISRSALINTRWYLGEKYLLDSNGLQINGTDGQPLRNKEFIIAGNYLLEYNGFNTGTINLARSDGDPSRPSVDIVTIGARAFEGWAMAGLFIPESVVRINAEAFLNCNFLSAITFAADSKLVNPAYGVFNQTPWFLNNPSEFIIAGSTLIAYRGNDASVTIPDTVTVIGYQAFANRFSSEIIIPNTVTLIQREAFAGCTQLASVIIPASVRTIEDWAFFGNTSLATLTFAADSQLEFIGDRAFINASSLTSVAIPAAVRHIGVSAFQGTGRLATLTFAAGSALRTMGAAAFSGTIALTKVEIPRELVEIPANAFFNAVAMTELTFAVGSQLRTIGTSAFQGAAITSLQLPNELRIIGVSAFEDCDKLVWVRIMDNIQRIENRAFFNTLMLSSVEIRATVPPIIFENSIHLRRDGTNVNVFDLRIYVPISPNGAIRQVYCSADGFSIFNNTTVQGALNIIYEIGDFPTVTFNLNGGSGSIPPFNRAQSIQLGGPYAPSPTQDGRVFLGWDIIGVPPATNPHLSPTAEYRITRDVTLIARWSTT